MNITEERLGFINLFYIKSGNFLEKRSDSQHATQQDFSSREVKNPPESHQEKR